MLDSAGAPRLRHGIQRRGPSDCRLRARMTQAAVTRHCRTASRSWLQELLAEGGRLLAEFAGNGNADGVQQLLDLGVPVDALYDGDPYFDIAKDSTALHVAAWKAWPKTVKLLIERGANDTTRKTQKAEHR